MAFTKEIKPVILGTLVVGVIGLVVNLVRGDFGFGSGIKADHAWNFDLPRAFLFIWEFFWLAAVIVFFFKFTKNATSEKDEKTFEKIEGFEPKFFKIMISILVFAGILTLLVPAFFGPGLSQYNTDNEGIVVNVVASQYTFTFNGSTTIELQVGVNYIFNLTTTDTTHGFGLYDTNGILLIQAQIVPGHPTNLSYTFEETGLYSVYCMEYCSAGHHAMRMNDVITVV
ncbi:MAG: hypothetical protein OEY49_15515 [Candidatus Heimdallarchaeota archaeon]|nr:hypothetical protein [Candidatus Heimdallarchaeota archaeon]